MGKEKCIETLRITAEWMRSSSRALNNLESENANEHAVEIANASKMVDSWIKSIKDEYDPDEDEYY